MLCIHTTLYPYYLFRKQRKMDKDTNETHNTQTTTQDDDG